MKSKILLPAIFILVLAISRVPGLLPWNFSVVYAFMFCAGVFFPRQLVWWLPLTTILVTDIGLNFYYQYKGYTVWDGPDLANLAFNYAAYAVLILLGRGFKPNTSLIKLVGGGLLGAILFYVITNTASWFFNPFHNAEYTRTIAGWITALTKGINGWPSTWEFFRHTLLSAGLFTALFATAHKLTAESPAEKTAGAREPKAAEGEHDAEPEEAKA
ncbi:MAG TPA: DUF6580 family putative transport protein [Verrucomicrobiae bacterium]|nr:DUF6580 family putative transport protein [Verrucomicrobiae bacterium]